jgi:8-oxo-dGTP diphosphatase
MEIIDKLAWIEIKDNSILLTKSFGKEKFYIPGGKREIDESDEQALLREIQEELSVTIDKNTLKFIGVFEAQAHGQPEGVFVKMTCYSGNYFGQITASSEIEEIEWFKYTDKYKVVGVDKLIFEYLKQNELLC